MMDTVPPSLDAMNEDQAEDLINRIRARRMRVVRELEEAREAARKVAEEKLRAKLGKQCEMLEREVTRLDALIDKCESRVDKIRALRLEGDVL